jgi:putative flavoprotein involved in K+ transport
VPRRYYELETGMLTTESIHTVIIGAGQAGLAAGYHLKKRGVPLVILEANERVGDSWRKRWDSLRLFTPAKYDSIDGMPFPAPPWSFPTKDEMADYLEAYVQQFNLPVRTGVNVDRLSRRGDRFVISAGDLEIEADNVVVAMATYQKRVVPSFAARRGVARGRRQLGRRDRDRTREDTPHMAVGPACWPRAVPN